MRARRLATAAWVSIGLVVAVFALKTFVGDVYRVSSSSMEPTLHTGEYVLVRFESGAPRRGDLVVYDRGGVAVVKRVMGLEGESVLIGPDGGLFVDGRRPGEGRAPWVKVFDAATMDVAEHFRTRGSIEGAGDPWRRTDEGWELDARGIELGRGAGLMWLRRGVHDDWLDEHGRLQCGSEHVGDLRLELEVCVRERGGRMRLVLNEEGDTFQVAIDLSRAGEAARLPLELTRSNALGTETLARASVELPLGRWTRIAFANRGDELTVSCGSREVLEARYESNQPHPRDVHGEGLSIAERVQLGGEGCLLSVRGLLVQRAVTYTRRGEFGVSAPLELGPGELFVLGDHSAASRDSRELGPLRQEEVFGRAVSVVWPLSRVRRLE